MAEIVIVGAGIGGLSAAVVLAARGYDVEVLEAADRPGGKAGVVVIDGVEVDTGPSVLTLPERFDEVFAAAGTTLAAEGPLRRLDPGFRYLWPDGAVVDTYHDPADTIAAVARALGADAGRELAGFLAYAKRIWDAAAPHFILGDAPNLGTLLWKGPLLLGSLAAIDPLRTMRQGIEARVREPHLRDLLTRYATYNGSDPRAAPATLNCIAHVELGLGGYGLEGGIHALIDALVRVATRHGAKIRCDARVSGLLVEGGRVVGARLDGGGHRRADAVVVNADVGHLLGDLWPREAQGLGFGPPEPPSTSGWTGILRARRRERVPHTVLFPANYTQEFVDLFDRDQPPTDPTVYLCAQEPAHGRTGWAEDEPVFVMANAPAEPRTGQTDPAVWEALAARVLERIRSAGLATPEDALVWRRSPTDLAARFPGSRGALYGAASNTRFAAFQRPPNRVRAAPGLYLASGSAHPGGGLPLCARSGAAAAQALHHDLAERRR